MYYTITAYNTQSLVVWASSEADVERYVDWLNRNKEINLYAYAAATAEQQEEYEGRDDVLSMDEPCWDDFMHADAE